MLQRHGVWRSGSVLFFVKAIDAKEEVAGSIPVNPTALVRGMTGVEYCARHPSSICRSGLRSTVDFNPSGDESSGNGKASSGFDRSSRKWYRQSARPRTSHGSNESCRRFRQPGQASLRRRSKEAIASADPSWRYSFLYEGHAIQHGGVESAFSTGRG